MVPSYLMLSVYMLMWITPPFDIPSIWKYVVPLTTVNAQSLPRTIMQRRRQRLSCRCGEPSYSTVSILKFLILLRCFPLARRPDRPLAVRHCSQLRMVLPGTPTA